MTHPIDTAYVDIVPVDRSLEKLQQDIDKMMKMIEKNAKKDLEKLDDDFGDLASQVDKHFAGMQLAAKTNLKKIEDHVEVSLKEVSKDVNKTFNDIDEHFKEIGDDSDITFRKVRSRFLEPLNRGLQKVGDIATDVGRAIFQLFGAVGGAISSNPLVSLIVVLTPAIIALAAALSQLVGLVGLLPGGFSILLAAILPVVVAFQNFGDAVSALTSGDVEKIDEAFAKLAPSARSVAKEVAQLIPLLKTFQLNTQQAFFKPLIGVLTALGKSTLPALELGFTRVAFAMGTLLRQVLDFFSLPEQATFIDNLFKTTSQLITVFGPNLVKFMAGILEVANAALPTLAKLGDAFSAAFGRFGDFLAKSASDGSLQAFIDDALKTAGELFDLLKALGDLVATLFAGTEESGHDFLQTLTDMVIRINDFLKTDTGRKSIELLVLAVKLLGAALETTMETLIFFTETFFGTMHVLAEIGRGIGPFFERIWNFLVSLRDRIMGFVSTIPGLIMGFIQNAIDTIFTEIGLAIGLGMLIIQELPGKIAEFLMSLPQRIHDILTNTSDTFTNSFQNMIDRAIEIVVNGGDQIWEIIKSLPIRLVGLGQTFLNAGKNLIQSFMNGFRSVGGFIGDIAGDIVNSIRGFLNRAIDRINSGIAIIDNILPGDLSRIPRLAQGAFVPRQPGGILANIGEGSEDEWVLPESKLMKIIAEAGGGGANFGPGSIVVNFSGALPTEGQARNIGAAIGQGINDAISRRNIRAQVRAV